MHASQYAAAFVVEDSAVSGSECMVALYMLNGWARRLPASTSCQQNAIGRLSRLYDAPLTSGPVIASDKPTPRARVRCALHSVALEAC